MTVESASANNKRADDPVKLKKSKKHRKDVGDTDIGGVYVTINALVSNR